MEVYLLQQRHSVVCWGGCFPGRRRTVPRGRDAVRGHAPASQPLHAQSPGGKGVDKILFRESLTPADDKHIVAKVKQRRKENT